MDKLEALSRVFTFSAAFDERNFQKMADAAGLSKELTDTMTVPEIMDALLVRIHDLAKIAGVPMPQESDNE
jgi:hypothetical protein